MTVDPNAFSYKFKERIKDNFIQKWKADIQASNVLSFYKYFKVSLDYENYLNCSKYRKFRNVITQLRLSSHPLRIETGRYGQNRMDRNERKCQICNSNDIEDEYHFVLICPIYMDLRLKYISRYYRNHPSVYKFIQLLNTDKPKDINNLSYYVYHAFKVRNGKIQNNGI